MARESIHAFAARCRRSAAGDEQAARNYERLAAQDPARRDEHLSRAAESRTSAQIWLGAVSARLGAKAEGR